MTRQFKLVTEKEYEMLQKMRDAPQDQQQNVWKTDFPDEVKAMLYQDFMRRMLRKKDEEERKPIPVTLPPELLPKATPDPEIPSKAETPEPLVSTPVESFGVLRKITHLMNYFDEQGFTTGDGGLNMGGIVLNRAEALALARVLCDGRVSISKANPAALAYLKSQFIPLKLLAPNKHSYFETKKWTKLEF